MARLHLRSWAVCVMWCVLGLMALEVWGRQGRARTKPHEGHPLSDFRRPEDRAWLTPVLGTPGTRVAYACPDPTSWGGQLEGSERVRRDYEEINRNASKLFTQGLLSPHDCSGMGGRYGLSLAGYSQFVETLAAKLGVKPGDHVFEAGMGCGAFHYFLRKLPEFNATFAYGIDFTESMLRMARVALPYDGPFCQATLSDYGFVPSASMDYVVSVGALEYLGSGPEALKAVAEMVRVLKPGGHLATILNNDMREGSTAAMSDKLFQPPSWWASVAPQLGMTEVETIREADGIYGGEALWQRGKMAGRYTVIMRKVK